MQKLPFVTENAALAMALHFGGCHILDIWRVFADEKSAKDNRGGKVQFFIHDGDNRAALMAAFDSVEKSEKMDIPGVSNEDAARIVRLVLKFRGDVMRMLNDPASIRIASEKGAPSVTKHEDGSSTINHPGMRLHSLNASAATKERIRQ